MRILLFAALLLLTAPAARAWVSVEAPPQSTVTWVARDMVYNGVPMRIQYFHSKHSPAQVLDYYRQRWTDGGKKNYVENTVGPWRNISRAKGDVFVTVQARPAAGGTTEGYLSQRPLKSPPPPQLGRGAPLPPGSEVVNDILSNDGDRQSRTLLAYCPLSVDASAAHYREAMGKDGWTLVNEGKARSGGRQMVLRKDDQELSLAFSPSGNRTAIGMTIVKR
jgi:hypothetical protein